MSSMGSRVRAYLCSRFWNAFGQGEMLDVSGWVKESDFFGGGFVIVC